MLRGVFQDMVLVRPGEGAFPCVRAHFKSSVKVFKRSEEKDERGREKGST